MPLPANARKPNEPIQTHEPIASYVRRMLQIHVVTPTPMKNDDAVDQCICQMYIMTHLQLFFFYLVASAARSVSVSTLAAIAKKHQPKLFTYHCITHL